MLEKLNAIYEQVLKGATKKEASKTPHVKVKKSTSMNQNCRVIKKKVRTKLSQKKNIK